MIETSQTSTSQLPPRLWYDSLQWYMEDDDTWSLRSQEIPNYASTSADRPPGYHVAVFMVDTDNPPITIEDPATLTVSAATAVFDLKNGSLPCEMEGHPDVGLIMLAGIRCFLLKGDVTSYRGFEAKNRSTLVVKGNATIYGPASLWGNCKLIVYGKATFHEKVKLSEKCWLVSGKEQSELER